MSTEISFNSFALHEDVMEGALAMGFEKPTPIQEQAVPVALEGKDIIGIAQTGTGKTAAFLLPTMSRILQGDRKGIGALIIVPTRELAIQIDQAIEGLGYFAGISSMAIYGGGDASEFSQEKKALTSDTDIIVATPGRMMSHLNLGYADFSHLKCFILDEADRMLDMGFYQDIIRIVKTINSDRQTLLFSATMPDNIRQLAKQIQKDPVQINIALSKPAEGILQGAYVVFDHQKPDLIGHLLEGKDLKSVIVFSSTKRGVSEVYRMLRKKGLNCASISSDLEQKEREQVMLDFKNRKTAILVATDVVSRGIDIDDIELVINYDVPNDAEDYVHRIGRTARAAKTGVGLTLVGPDDQRKFVKIEQLIGSEIRKLQVPSDLGAVPEYNPPRRKPGNKGKFNHGRSKKPRYPKKR
ncbi:MAG: DEAD/DEAH box helicase [Flavobacteriales bacterium]|nr:DEAD/DEAH box helicase [Flavobacteriales bacterium]